MSDSPYATHLAGHPEDDAAREARHRVLATLLAAYADGELPVETASQIDAHLLGCGRCRSELRVQRAVGDRLARSTVPAATAALQARVRAAVSATEPPKAMSATAPVHSRRRVTSWVPSVSRLPSPVFLLIIALSVAGIGLWSSRQAAPRLDPPPLVATSMVAFQSIVDDYRRVAQGDLPGRARDLDAVRNALPFPVTPITDPDAHLLAAWTADLDGEPAGVLAYRWNERVVLQYIVGEASLFRAREVRAAIAARRAVVVQDGPLGLVAWPEASAGSVLVGDVPWTTLVALHPASVR